MTFMKYVDLDLCCFIPGKVIDEIFTVLRTIQAERNPPRAYEVLQVMKPARPSSKRIKQLGLLRITNN
jgi:F-box protein 28